MKPQAESLEALGQDLTQSARLARDVAEPIRDLVAQLPADSLPKEQLDHQIEAWRSWHDTARKVERVSTVRGQEYRQHDVRQRDDIWATSDA